MGQFTTGTGQYQQVAFQVGANNAAIVHQRAQDLVHFRGRYILQWPDQHTVVIGQRRNRVRQLGRRHSPVRLGNRHHPVLPIDQHQGGIVHPEQGFQGGQQVRTGDRCAGLHGHTALNRGIQHVIQLEGVTQDHLHHFTDIGILKI